MVGLYVLSELTKSQAPSSKTHGVALISMMALLHIVSVMHSSFVCSFTQGNLSPKCTKHRFIFSMVLSCCSSWSRMSLSSLSKQMEMDFFSVWGWPLPTTATMYQHICTAWECLFKCSVHGKVQVQLHAARHTHTTLITGWFSPRDVFTCQE